jgi:hypothetical protein
VLDQAPLIPGVNAVPLDPNVQFQVGDLLPRQVLQEPTGSRAALLFNSSWENGRWIVERQVDGILLQFLRQHVPLDA